MHVRRSNTRLMLFIFYLLSHSLSSSSHNTNLTSPPRADTMPSIATSSPPKDRDASDGGVCPDIMESNREILKGLIERAPNVSEAEGAALYKTLDTCTLYVC